MSLFDGLLNKAPAKTVDAATYSLDVAPIITTGPSTPVATTQDIVMAPVTAQVATIVEPPMVTPVEISLAPSETQAGVPEGIQAETPSEIQAEEMLSIAEEPREVPEVSPVENQVDFSITDADTISFLKDSSEEVVAPEIMPNTMSSSASLFDMVSEPTVAPSISTRDNTPESENVINMNSFTTEATFRNTAEFIGYTLEGAEILRTSLKAANDAKIEERDEYKNQEKHFAELKKNADNEHKIMLIEMKHADDMYNYLKEELAKTEAPAANDEEFTIAA